MPIMYARCDNFMSGATSSAGVNCKFMAIGESEEDVYEKVIEHLTEAHLEKFRTPSGGQASPRELENTIKRCIFTKGTKVFGTRAPQEH